jgi:hypothetical protein
MTISLQTFMPSVVTPNTQILVTDIDGDGTNEVIMLDTNLGQLSISHRFQYDEISLSDISGLSSSSTTPIWSDSTPHWMTTGGVPFGGIPVTQGATFSPWKIAMGDEIMIADLDGDGIDELFIYNLRSFSWGVLKWYTTGLQTIANVSVAPGAGGSSVSPPLTPVTWQASAADHYFVVPNLSSIMAFVIPHAAGILCYNSETYALAMIAYSEGSFSEPWNTTQTTLPGGWQLNPNHPAPTINQFYPGYFAIAGVPSIVVYSPTTNYMSLLQWDPQQKQFTSSPGQGHQAGGWDFGSEDQYHVADLDGDSMSEIFIYAPNDGNIGLLKWVNKSIQSFAITNKQLNQVRSQQHYQWQPGGNDQYFCLNGSGNIPGPIYAFSPDQLNLALLSYAPQPQIFTCVWSGTSLPPNNAWNVTASDSFYAGPSWDSATPSLITLSNQGPSASPVLTLGALGLNGQNLSNANQIQFDSSQTVPIPAWSPAGLASNAPSTAFTPFPPGNQQQIYVYISQLFPIPRKQPNPTTDIRSLYTNTGDSGKWETYAGALAPIQLLSQIPSSWPPLPPNNNWADNDWSPVLNQIVTECNQVDTAYGVFSDLQSVAGDLNSYQQDDLTTVTLNIQQLGASNPQSVYLYWLGQIFVAALWGFAGSAGLFLKEAAAATFGVFFSTVASVAGSVVGYNPVEQQSYALESVEQDVENTMAVSIVNNSLDLTAILGDPVKLNILDGLHDNVWLLDTSLPATIKQPFQLVDRLWMYQFLLPFYVSIDIVEPGVFYPATPTYLLNNVGYFLKDQSGNISPSQFQGTNIYTDLFTNIGVSEEDFFVGNGGWSNIKRTTMSPTPNNSGPDGGEGV